MSINAINVNSSGIQGGYIMQSQVKQENKKSQEEQTLVSQNNRTQYSPDDVFKHMSANFTQPVVSPKKTLNVSNYVNADSASRIADSMSNFEAQFDENVNALFAEFGDKMSDSAVAQLALKMMS